MKKTLAIILAMIMVLSLVACGNSPSQSDPPVSTNPSTTNNDAVNSNTPEKWSSDLKIDAWGGFDPQVSGVAIIADKMGFFKEEGLNDFTLNFMQTGADMVPLCGDPTIKVLFIAASGNAKASANGCDTVSLAAITNMGGTQTVTAGKGVTVNGPSDLLGKKIGMLEGADIDIGIRKMCDEYGVDYSALNFLYMDASTALAALENGDIDVMAMWEPYNSYAVEFGGTALFNGINSYMNEVSGEVGWLNAYTTVTVQDDFKNEHPEECAAIIRACIKAVNYINENKEDAAKIIAEVLGLELENCLMILNANGYSVHFGQELYEATQAQAEYGYNMGWFDVLPEYDDYMDPSIIKQVDENLFEQYTK